MNERKYGLMLVYGGGMLLFFLAGICILLAFALHSEYAKISDDTRFSNNVLTTTRMVYGIVDSVDTEKRIVALRTQIRFDENDAPRTVLISLTKDAYIARRDLEGQGDEYDSITDSGVVPLESVQPGDRAATFAEFQDGTFISRYFTFGNPI